jgi:glycosyltransferase involved in cell wall biosynthesis
VVIIGDGDLRDELEKMCADSGIQPFVRFTGIRVDIPTLLAAFDIFVMPSLTEGMPMALLEAMAAAKPVISTSVGSIPQVIEQNHSGILVPPGNIHALTIALEGVLADLSSAQEFGQNARERISKYYSASLKAREYIEIYKQYFRLVN